MTDLLNLAAVDNLPGRTIIGPTHCRGCRVFALVVPPSPIRLLSSSRAASARGPAIAGYYA